MRFLALTGTAIARIPCRSVSHSRREYRARAPGIRLRRALEKERPLQIVGVIHAYAAIMAGQAGFAALYLSGAGVANASHGLSDLGFTTLDDVVEDVRRICGATHLPLLVDADTGWSDDAWVGYAVRELSRAGAAGMHIEDQVSAKRCGHRQGKALVSTAEMAGRIRAAVRARPDPSFVIMARTDAVGVEGTVSAIARVRAYVKAGADMIFPEALTTLDQYRKFVENAGAPIMANITEFGVTPLFTLAQLRRVGVRIVLYPLSAFRAMNAAAGRVYRTIRKTGTQRSLLGRMQTRRELYDSLRYEAYERMMDRLLKIEAEAGR